MRNPNVSNPGSMWLWALVNATWATVFAAAGTSAARQMERGSLPRPAATSTPGSHTSAAAPYRHPLFVQ
jgi:hypothetical protein